MFVKVKIQQTGREFQVEHDESVLEAAIRAGIGMDYGCNNGNCGRCKARVLKGNTARIRHHDFVISQAEQSQGFALMCSNTATTDLLLDAKIATDASDIPVQKFRVKVRKLEIITEDLAILHLQTPRTHRLRFMAGQYATLSIEDFGARDYSIASCPCDDLRLEFHVRRMDDNPFSAMIFNDLKQGDRIDIEAPRGDFVLREDSRRPFVFIAFDIGFAAIKSQLEHLTAQEQEASVVLYWIACDKKGHYLNNLCRSWADALDNFTYTPLAIEAEYQRLTESSGQSLEMLEKCLQKTLSEHHDLDKCDIYISAPALVLETTRNLLLGLGIEAGNLYLEPARGDPNVLCLGQ